MLLDDAIPRPLAVLPASNREEIKGPRKRTGFLSLFTFQLSAKLDPRVLLDFHDPVLRFPFTTSVCFEGCHLSYRYAISEIPFKVHFLNVIFVVAGNVAGEGSSLGVVPVGVG